MYQQGYRPTPAAPPRPAVPLSQPAPKSSGREMAQKQTRSGPRKPAGGGAPNAPYGGGVSRPRRKKSGLSRAFWLMVILALLAGGAYYGKTWLEVSPYDQLFVNNVFVDGIHLGGLTAQQGIEAIRQSAAGRENGLAIRLMYGEQHYTTITSDMLAISYDTNSALNQAWTIGHQGTVFDRKREMDAVKAAPQQIYSAVPGANTQVIDSILLNLKNELYQAPVDAALLTFDANSTDPFTFQQEVMGRSLDIDPLKTEIYRMVGAMESGDVQIVPTYTAPRVTVEMLRETVALRFRATTPISPDSTENRTNNIRRAFQSISGKVLAPGEKFSFNSEVGWRTTKNGFFEAIEYAYGETTEGIGGGVCQASTTLYQAAICSGLEILDREPHSDKVSYTPYGKDATVYMSSNRKIDFVFKNNTEGNIYIAASVKTDPSNRKRFVCEVAMYGMSLGNVRYELVAEEVRTIPAPAEPEYVKDTKQKYVTYKDEEYQVIKAREGHVVQSFLVKYVDGVQADRIFVAEDTYKERAARIYRGVKDR